MTRALADTLHGVKWIAATTILLALVAASSGIKCYKCNSFYDKRCGDPFDNYTSEVVDCQQEDHRMSHLPLNEEGKPYEANICRKTVQIVNEETRVIRSCGWLPNDDNMKDRDCFTRTGTHQVMVYHCVCKGDKCNGAEQTSTILPLVLTMALLPQLAKWSL